MAAMMTSGLMFFSREICSICCLNWFAIDLLELHFEAAVRDLRERNPRGRPLFLLQGHRHRPVLHRLEAARPVPAALPGLVARELHQPADEAAVIRLRPQRP